MPARYGRHKIAVFSQCDRSSVLRYNPAFSVVGVLIRFDKVGYNQSCVWNIQRVCNCCYDQPVAAPPSVGICRRGIEIVSEHWEYRVCDCETVHARDFARQWSGMSIARVLDREYAVVQCLDHYGARIILLVSHNWYRLAKQAIVIFNNATWTAYIGPIEHFFKNDFFNIFLFSITVEPLSNEHPHKRPSLLNDHILCDGQCFLFVRSLTNDHPSDATNDRVRWDFLPRERPPRLQCISKNRGWRFNIRSQSCIITMLCLYTFQVAVLESSRKFDTFSVDIVDTFGVTCQFNTFCVDTFHTFSGPTFDTFCVDFTHLAALTHLSWHI